MRDSVPAGRLWHRCCEDGDGCPFAFEIATVLRITQVDEPTLTRLKVEGRLDARSVGELLRSCRPALRGRAVVLDFSSVLFVDRSAALAVRQLLAQDVRLEACPPFIAQLLEEDPNALAGS